MTNKFPKTKIKTHMMIQLLLPTTPETDIIILTLTKNKIPPKINKNCKGFTLHKSVAYIYIYIQEHEYFSPLFPSMSHLLSFYLLYASAPFHCHSTTNQQKKLETREELGRANLIIPSSSSGPELSLQDQKLG